LDLSASVQATVHLRSHWRSVVTGCVISDRQITFYMVEVFDIIVLYGFDCHVYADDIQVFLRFRLAHLDSLNVSHISTGG